MHLGVQGRAVAAGLGQCVKSKTRKARQPGHQVTPQELLQLRPLRTQPWSGPSGVSLQGGEAQSALSVFFCLPVSPPPSDRGVYRTSWGFK